ncbi:nuclear transport factor 2 family protein [Streptomyces sp. 4N509B]|uniref:nuclear transport factor 2 family protein n=1 Tax=Streptomyces sp. 4N509B TaxID=3457413 RepID=UPI003FD3C6AD
MPTQSTVTTSAAPSRAASELADRAEIVDLLTRLAHLLDDARFEDAPAVYADDVVVHSPRGGTLRGIEEVLAFLNGSRVEGERTLHVHGDILVTFDGPDRAGAAAHQLVFFFRDGQPPHRSSGLRLSYGAVRTPDGWRVDEAHIVPAFIREGA